MSAYLVDTNVVSAAAPHDRPRSALADWMDARSSALFLSSISVAEIAAGIAKLRREGATRKATALSDWLDAVLHLYGNRILPFETATGLIAGALSDAALARGGAPGFADVAIAATASQHELVFLTRNRRHFELFDVPFLDPFDALPKD
jgi:predicted nucleic acid-binding protein